jgi:hypothetical protein
MQNEKPSIQELLTAFDEWRAIRKSPNESPPENLCELLRRAVTCYGVNRVRATVGLTKGRMNKCLGKTATTAKSEAVAAEEEAASFSEIIVSQLTPPPHGEGLPVCIVESGNGARLIVFSAEPCVCDLIGAFVANLPQSERRC